MCTQFSKRANPLFVCIHIYNFDLKDSSTNKASCIHVKFGKKLYSKERSVYLQPWLKAVRYTKHPYLCKADRTLIYPNKGVNGWFDGHTGFGKGPRPKGCDVGSLPEQIAYSTARTLSNRWNSNKGITQSKHQIIQTFSRKHNWNKGTIKRSNNRSLVSFQETYLKFSLNINKHI